MNIANRKLSIKDKKCSKYPDNVKSEHVTQNIVISIFLYIIILFHDIEFISKRFPSHLLWSFIFTYFTCWKNSKWKKLFPLVCDFLNKLGSYFGQYSLSNNFVFHFFLCLHHTSPWKMPSNSNYLLDFYPHVNKHAKTSTSANFRDNPWVVSADFVYLLNLVNGGIPSCVRHRNAYVFLSSWYQHK